jgi:hypothetical protein
MVAHELQQPDNAARICFFSWLPENMHDEFMDLQILFIADEAWFYPSGHVSVQNV